MTLKPFAVVFFYISFFLLLSFSTVAVEVTVSRPFPQCPICRYRGSWMHIYNEQGKCRNICVLPGGVVPTNALYCGACPLAPVPRPTAAPTVAPTPTPAGQFDIVLDLTNVDSLYRSFFTSAEARWESVIRGDIADQVVTADIQRSIPCQVTVGTVIDDLLICARTLKIDGSGGILATASVRFVRMSDGKPIPVASVITVDSDDVQILSQTGFFESVVVRWKSVVLYILNYEKRFALVCCRVLRIYLTL